MDKNTTPQPAGRPKVFDVMRPGKAPAAATARPVITGHKPLKRDPLLARSAPEPERPVLLNAKHKVIVEPSATPTVAEETQETLPASAAPVPSPDNSSQPAVPAPQATPAPEVMATIPPHEAPEPQVEAKLPETPQPETTPSTTPAPQPTNTGTPSVPAAISEPPSDSTPTQTISDELNNPEDETILAGLAPNFDSNDIVVSHHKQPFHFPAGKLVITLLLLLVLAAAIYDVLLDASFVNNQFDLPHTNFFDQ